jgi:dynein light intermediate chain
MAVPASLIKFEQPLRIGGDAGATMDRGKGGGGGPKVSSQTEEILNSVLPPRKFDADDAQWIQYVSKSPATRLDVYDLQENLDMRVMERQAREAGICPVREDLYTQAFDELIRQVTLNGPERGLLLLRVRDEIRMTIDAYKTLYNSSVTFGIRKQLQAEQGMSELEVRVASLEETKRQHENAVLELRNKVEVVEKRENERRTLEEKKRKEEIDFLKYQGHNLDQFLKSITGGK